MLSIKLLEPITVQKSDQYEKNNSTMRKIFEDCDSLPQRQEGLS